MEPANCFIDVECEDVYSNVSLRDDLGFFKDLRYMDFWYAVKLAVL